MNEYIYKKHMHKISHYMLRWLKQYFRKGRLYVAQSTCTRTNHCDCEISLILAAMECRNM